MKWIRSTYYTLHVLKAADPKLRKAIIANCSQETLKRIWECALNVFRGNIPPSACSKRKVRMYMNSIRKVADKSISVSAKRKVIGQRRGLLLPLLSAILSTPAGLVFRLRLLCYIKCVWPPPKLFRNTSSQQVPYSSKIKRKICMKLPPQSAYDKLINVSEMLREQTSHAKLG